MPFLSGSEEIDACFAKSGLARGAVHEIMPASARDRASGVAFAAALLARTMAESDGSAMLVTSEASRRDFGTLHGPGSFALASIHTPRRHRGEKRPRRLMGHRRSAARSSSLAGVLALMGKSVSATGRSGSSLKETHLPI